MHIPPVNIGLLERLGAPLFRPNLKIAHEGARMTEEVTIAYPTTIGKSRYIRAWVYNSFGFPAHSCQVFVDRVSHYSNLVERERSPLHWTDVDDCYLWPEMRKGYENGHYIDICQADSVLGRLQIISQKAKKGYHLFSDAGLYKIELTAEATKPCRFGSCTLMVDFDPAHWENLKVTI